MDDKGFERQGVWLIPEHRRGRIQHSGTSGWVHHLTIHNPCVSKLVEENLDIAMVGSLKRNPSLKGTAHNLHEILHDFQGRSPVTNPEVFENLQNFHDDFACDKLVGNLLTEICNGP